MLEYDRDGEGIPTVILSQTKDLAEPGNGTLGAQILRQELRMTILTHRFPSSPPVVSGQPSLFLFAPHFLLFTSTADRFPINHVGNDRERWMSDEYRRGSQWKDLNACHPERSEGSR